MMKRKLLALALAGLLCLGFAPPAHAAVEELVSLRVDEVVAYSSQENIYTVRRDGLYGFYRTDGSPLLEPNYAAVGPYSGGMAAVSLTGEETGSGKTARLQGGRFGYVDAGGVLTVAMQYRQAFPFSEGRAFAVDASGTLVLLDRTGQELASFPQAELWEGESVQFSEGLAVIPVTGAADEAPEDGEAVVSVAAMKPLEAPEGEEDLPRTYLVVDSGGREVCTIADAWVDLANGYHGGRVAAAESGEWVRDEDGALSFAAAPGSLGYRDERGGLAVEFQFDGAEPFSDGLAAVCFRDGDGAEAWGFVSPEGEMIVPAEYDGARAFDEGVGMLLSEGLWAYVDQEGRLLTRFEYEEAGPFREGVALVRRRGRIEAIDQRGRTAFTTDAGEALPFSGGVAVLREAGKDGAWGVCDADGDLLVPYEYEEAFHWDGYLWLKRGELWRVYLTEDVIDASLAAPEGTAAGVGAFLDVAEGAWYAAAVTWATDHDVITGTGGGLFSPDRSCTTGEIVTFLWRAMGCPEPEGDNPFTDVSANHYYYQAALWAHENGIVFGDVFGAAELCSRGMAVTYLWRLAGSPGGYLPVFADVDMGAVYAQAVSWAVSENVTGGNGGGAFCPDDICNRGQIVTFLYRYLVEG